jgi:hypothetical protein
MRRHPVSDVAADVTAYEMVQETGDTAAALEKARMMKMSDCWHFWNEVEKEILLLAKERGE